MKAINELDNVLNKIRKAYDTCDLYDYHYDNIWKDNHFSTYNYETAHRYAAEIRRQFRSIVKDLGLDFRVKASVTVYQLRDLLGQFERYTNYMKRELEQCQCNWGYFSFAGKYYNIGRQEIIK